MFPVSDPDIKRRGRPIVNVLIVFLCAVVFVYELVIGEHGREILFYQFGMIPDELVHGADYGILVTGAGTFDIATPIPTWATPFTSMFLHADWLHFLVNMLFLWVFGDNVEDRFGHFKYLLFYLAAGVAGAWLQIVVEPSSQMPTVGASGAIAGVLGAYLLLFPFSRIRTVVVFFFITVVRVPALLLLGLWFLLQFVSGVGSLGPSTQTGGVAYWAHVGGFLLGVAVAVVYKVVTRQSIWPRKPGDGPVAHPRGPDDLTGRWV